MNYLKNLSKNLPLVALVLALVIGFAIHTSAQVVIPELWKISGTNLIPKNSSLTVGNSSTAGTFSTLTVTSCTGCSGGSIGQATSTLFSANQLWVGQTATSTIDSAGILTVPNNGLHILDTNATHDLIITPGSNLAADRILTITTGDAARTLTLSGNATLDDWFDQAVKTTSSPTFNALTLSTDLSVANGGTGASTLTGLLQGNGASAITGVTGTIGMFPFYNGTDTLSSTSTVSVDTNERVGISSTTPFTKLAIGSGAASVAEYTPATSTTPTIDWRNGNQQIYRHGTSATTFTFTGYIPGMSLRLWVCNPGASGGAITWPAGILWSGGTAPSQTTTANKCDLMVFNNTIGTSTPIITGAQNANY